MIRPSIKQLSYLTAVKEHGSFVAAADACAVTQSTLSAGIKELELALGQPLIIRNRKAAQLTPFGQEAFESAIKILNEADTLIFRSKILKESMSGPLRLGVIPTIAPYMLPDILPRVTADFPRLELQIFEDLTEHLLDMLRTNQIDIALIAFPYETPYLTQHILFEEQFYAATPGETQSNSNTINIKDLEADQLLLLTDGHCMREHALAACDLQAPKQRKAFSATSLPTIIQMVRAGHGMTLLPEMACRNGMLPDDVMLMRFMDKSPPTRKIGLCWRDDDPRKDDYETLAKSLL